MPGKAAWLAMDLPFEGDKGPDTRAGAVADRSPATCGLGDKPAGDFCVVVEQGIVLGVFEGGAMEPGPSTFRPSIPKDELAAWLDEHELRRTLLTTLDGRLVGVVRRDDLDA